MYRAKSAAIERAFASGTRSSSGAAALMPSHPPTSGVQKGHGRSASSSQLFLESITPGQNGKVLHCFGRAEYIVQVLPSGPSSAQGFAPSKPSPARPSRRRMVHHPARWLSTNCATNAARASPSAVAAAVTSDALIQTSPPGAAQHLPQPVHLKSNAAGGHSGSRLLGSVVAVRLAARSAKSRPGAAERAGSAWSAMPDELMSVQKASFIALPPPNLLEDATVENL